MGALAKVLLVLLSIDIALFLGGFQTQNHLLFGNLLRVNANVTTSGNISLVGINFSANVSSYNPALTGIVSSISQFFILPIFLVIDFINLVFSYFLGPVTLLNAMHAPPAVVILVGTTMILVVVMAFIGLIRGNEI